MKKIVLLTLILPFTIQAQNITVNATGYGNSIRSATKDALVSAVTQTNNAKITTRQTSSLKENTDNEDSNLESRINSDFALIANGVIERYTILNEQCTDNKCVVKIKAQVKPTKTQQLNKLNRKKVKIKSFKGKFSNTFNTALETSFTHGGGKFAIFEKALDNQMDYLIELALIKSKTKTWTKDNRKTDPLTGEISGKITRHYSSVYKVKYRVISSPLGQVKYTGTQSAYSKRNNLSILAKITAQKIYKDINNSIFPMRIASVYPSDNEISIPTDGKTFKIGDLFNIESISRVEHDPYTNEIIGQHTKTIGIAKVSTVERKIIYATIINGDISKMHPKMIVKPTKAQSKQIKHKKVYKKRSPSKIKSKNSSQIDENIGGVILN